jgi:hypothetical protein
MVRLITGAEYLPPLQRDLKARAFSAIERLGRVRLTPQLRAQINEVALQVSEEPTADAARPSASEVLDRLDRLIRVLRRARGAGSAELGAQLHVLLESDAVGEVLISLLAPPREPHIRALAGDDLEKRRSAMLATANQLRSHLKQSYAGMVGRHPDRAVDRMIERLYPIYLAAGGAPYRRNRRKDEPSQFTQFVRAAATMALLTYDPTMLTAENRPTWLKVGALDERVYIVLSPMAGPQRAARARNHAARRRARGPGK